MDDLLTCRICYEQYKEGVRAPVLLPRCGHTFCRPCVAYIQSGNTVICRFCSTEQRVESAEALPTEYSLLAIIAAREFQKAETCKIHEVKLSFWCRTCSEATCGECLFEDHPTHSHDVVRAQKYIQEMRIIARDIGDKFMEALDSREQRFYNRVFKGARAISNALRSVNVLRKDMNEARTLMKGAREVESIGPAKELCDAAKYLGLKWSIQDVNLYPKEKKEENSNIKDNKTQEEQNEEGKDKSEANNSEARESEDESKNKEDIAEKENETKENGDPEKKEGNSEKVVENKEPIEETKEDKSKTKRKGPRRYSDSDDSEEEVSRLKKIREEKEAARKKREAEKEAEAKLREEIMKQVKEEKQKKEEEKRKKEEEEKKAIMQERILGRQARLPKGVEEPQSNSAVPAEWLKKSKPKIARLKKAKTMSVVGPEPEEQSAEDPGKLASSTSTTNSPANKTTDDIPTDEQKKENELSVKKKKQEKNQIKSIEEENENEIAEDKNSNKNIDKNSEISNNEEEVIKDEASAVSENNDTKEKRNKERTDDDEDKDLDESAENTMVEYEPDDKPGGNKIKIDICQFPAFQIVVEGYGGRLARMEWEDKGLHVYCHQFQELPYDVIIKSAVLYSLIPTKAPLVFLDINGGKHNLGRVYIRLWGHLRRAQNFLTLCLGDLGSAYMCTRFLESLDLSMPGERLKGGDYELNTGHGGKALIKDLEYDDSVMPAEEGMLTAAGSQKQDSQFFIVTEADPAREFHCPHGTVISGLNVVKMAARRMSHQEVWIRNCGVVIEAPIDAL